jgi:uncharacterized membrane protein
MQDRRTLCQNSLSLFGGIGLGAGLMYLFDPLLGQRHRHRMRLAARDWYGRASQAIGSATGSLIHSSRRKARRHEGTEARSEKGTFKTAMMSWNSIVPAQVLKPLLGYGLLGAGIAYMLDPRGGRRRRSLIRDQFAHLWRKNIHNLGNIGRYVHGQSLGLLALLGQPFQRQIDLPDAKLVARVRTALGRASSHPHAIRVDADQGRVLLRGLVLARELPRVVSRVSRVRGVKELINRLESHGNPENIPSLQGQNARAGRRLGILREYWSPTTRLAVGGFGCGMTTYGLARKDLTGAALALVGLGLFTRAASNLPLKRLTGIHAGRRAIDIQKTININAPLEDVFRFLIDYENFPHFMHNIREVRDLGNGRSRWVVAGPAGMPVEWNSILTDYVPYEIIAWKSEPGSVVAHAGAVRFQRNDDGSARVDIKMSYNPPAGAIGHGLATLFGADPKHELDADLLRVKTLLETGHPAHDAARPWKGIGVL